MVDENSAVVIEPITIELISRSTRIIWESFHPAETACVSAEMAAT